MNPLSILRHHDVRMDEIRIMSLNGLDINITEHFQLIEIYESLFSNNISGRMSIFDAANLPKTLALSGQEMLMISFSSPPGGKSVTIGFVIDKISERMSQLLVTIK